MVRAGRVAGGAGPATRPRMDRAGHSRVSPGPHPVRSIPKLVGHIRGARLAALLAEVRPAMYAMELALARGYIGRVEACHERSSIYMRHARQERGQLHSGVAGGLA